MVVHLERVGRVRMRVRALRPSSGDETTAGELLAYLVSALIGVLIAFNVTGPMFARWLLGA